MDRRDFMWAGTVDGLMAPTRGCICDVWSSGNVFGRPMSGESALGWDSLWFKTTQTLHSLLQQQQLEITTENVPVNCLQFYDAIGLGTNKLTVSSIASSLMETFNH